MSTCMIGWAAISAATAGVKNYSGLVACRFFLGFVEAVSRTKQAKGGAQANLGRLPSPSIQVPCICYRFSTPEKSSLPESPYFILVK